LGENPTSYGPPSISPDGTTVAFDQSGIPYLFDWTNGVQSFDYSSFGFPELEEPVMTHPSWSPDSNQLAWIVAGIKNGEWQHGIGLFDLRDRNSQFLFPYEVEGFDGGRSIIYWNPNQEHIAVWNHGRDLLWIFSTSGTVELKGEAHSLYSIQGSPWNASGEWLVSTINDQELGKYGAYVISADGKESYKIGETVVVLWSPDGNWLILSNSHWRSPGEKWLIETGSWESQKLALPDDAYIIDWVEFRE
jgi:Tol biopolymer transport system component